MTDYDPHPQRSYDAHQPAVDVGPDTIVSEPQVDLLAALQASVDRARKDRADRRESETPAGRPPAAPSAPSTVESGSVDAGTSEGATGAASVVERVIDQYVEPDGTLNATPAWVAKRLVDAGLLADPDEVRRLREELDRERASTVAHFKAGARHAQRRHAAERERDAERLRDAQARVRSLEGALREVRGRLAQVHTPNCACWTCQTKRIIDRALSGEEQSNG